MKLSEALNVLILELNSDDNQKKSSKILASKIADELRKWKDYVERYADPQINEYLLKMAQQITEDKLQKLENIEDEKINTYGRKKTLKQIQLPNVKFEIARLKDFGIPDDKMEEIYKGIRKKQLFKVEWEDASNKYLAEMFKSRFNKKLYAYFTITKKGKKDNYLEYFILNERGRLLLVPEELFKD